MSPEPAGPLAVGITGATGFLGTHLALRLGLEPDRFRPVPVGRDAFAAPGQLRRLVARCQVLVHLAGVNRDPDPEAPFRENLALADRLAAALEGTERAPRVVFASSTQEETETPYGRGKRAARERLERWAVEHGGAVSSLVIPNLFGPFGRPHHNSVVATFCHQLTRGETPAVHQDRPLRLLYAGELARLLTDRVIPEARAAAPGTVRRLPVPHGAETTVSDLLRTLETFRSGYLERAELPALAGPFETDLFNTFRSYVELDRHFPVPHRLHRDARGAFAELVRCGSGGQVSFSTTEPGAVRGNHLHTRKVERFCVIRGQARIELRRADSSRVHAFDLSGSRPACVDIPVWHTHRLVNTGRDELYTVFWINEPYDPAAPDTYPLEVRQ